MASTWIVTRSTSSGEKRYRVEYRLGGREAPTATAAASSEARSREPARRGSPASSLRVRVPDLGRSSRPRGRRPCRGVRAVAGVADRRQRVDPRPAPGRARSCAADPR